MVRRLANDSALTQMDVGKLAIAVLQLHPYRTRRCGPASANFSQGIFEPVEQIDADAMFISRDGIDDGFPMAVGTSVMERHWPPIHIDLERMGANIGSCSFSTVVENT